MSEFRRVLRLEGPYHWAVFGVILILAAISRARGLGQESVWFDECFSVYYLKHGSLAAALAEFQEGNPQVQPLYAILLYCYSGVAGTSVLALRYFSVICGMIAIVQTYHLGRLVYDRTTGLIAAAIMGSVTFFVYHSQEMRMYSLMLVIGIASATAFVYLMRGPNRVAWVVHGLATLAMAWTHAAGLLFLIPQFLVLAVSRNMSLKHKAIWCTIQTVAVFTLLFWWMGVDHSKIAEVTRDQPSPGWTVLSGMPLGHTLTGYFWAWSGGMANPKLPSWLGWVDPVYRWSLLLIPIIAAGTFLIRRSDSDDEDSRTRFTGYLVLWFLLPPFILFLLSRFVGLDFFLRYAITSAVPMYILFAAAVSRSTPTSRRFLVVAFIIVFSIVRNDAVGRPWRVPWQTIVSWVVTETSPGTPVYAFQQDDSRPPLYETPFSFYAGPDGPTLEYAFGDEQLKEVISEDGPSERILIAVGPVAGPLEEKLEAFDASYERAQIEGLHGGVAIFRVQAR